MISIIVPIYNTEKYLRQCLDSIQRQTYKDWEAILVDDGSSDGSPAICDEYAEKNSQIRVYHKQNEGVAIARNVGLDHASGEYVTFVDSDDWVEPNYLSTLAKNAGKADIIFFSHNQYCEDGDIVRYQMRPSLKTDKMGIEKEVCHLYTNLAQHDYYGYTWIKMFRMGILRKYGIKFIPGQYAGEDEILTNEYVTHIQSLMTLDNVLYNYRWSRNGLTNRHNNAYNLRNVWQNCLMFGKHLSYPTVRKIFLEKAINFAIEEYKEDRHLYLFRLLHNLHLISKEGNITINWRSLWIEVSMFHVRNGINLMKFKKS